MTNDELLNKYIDNELSEVEYKELTGTLKTDSELQAKLKALQLADEILHKMEVTPAPQNFTEKFMRNFGSVSVVKEKVSYFFVGMISVFVLTIVGIIGYSASKMEPSSSSKLLEGNEYVQKTKEFFSGGVGELTSILGSQNILLIGGVLTFVLLISGYFIIESHKNFKQKLNRFSH